MITATMQVVLLSIIFISAYGQAIQLPAIPSVNLYPARADDQLHAVNSETLNRRDTGDVPACVFPRDVSESVGVKVQRGYAFGTCPNEEYYEWFYNVYDRKCRYMIGNRTYDEEKYLMYCDEECGTPYLNFLTSCGGEVGEQYANYFKNLCYENSDGVPCAYYFLATEYLQPTYYVEENCELPYQNGTSCSFDCFVSLHELKYHMGCCVNNIYNHTRPSDLAAYGLWSKCGVNTPYYCTGGATLVIPMFISTAFALLSLAF